MSISIVSRLQWRALPPKEEKKLKLPTKDISFVFTEKNTCVNKEECIQEIQRLQKESMENGLPDIEYNFLIGGDKRIYRGRGWKTEVNEDTLLVGYLGSSRGKYNSLQYTLCLIGGDKKIYRGGGWNTKVNEDAMLVGYLGSSRGDREFAWKMISKGYDLLMYALLTGKAAAVYKKPEGDIDVSPEERHMLLGQQLHHAFV